LDESSNLATLKIKSTPWQWFTQDSGMPPAAPAHWIQQPFFRSLVDAKIEQGISKEMQAHGIGISHSSLITWYSGTRAPGIKTIKMMAQYYGCQLADLTDDPGAALPGLEPGALSGMTPAKRLVMRSIVQKLDDPEVSDDVAERVWLAIQSLIVSGVVRPPK
jgi:DNA-binding XRE family transcriptional regulator